MLLYIFNFGEGKATSYFGCLLRMLTVGITSSNPHFTEM